MSITNILNIGWAEADITPEQTVLVAGQFAARLSEEILDPLKAVVLVLQSGAEQAVMVCCDLVYITPELRNSIRKKVEKLTPEIDPFKIVINATHTHTAPEVSVPANSHVGSSGISDGGNGVELEAMPILEYIEFAAARIAAAIDSAWNSRAAGGISYGSGFAVLGRNRRWVDRDGMARMYGLSQKNADSFLHFEGYEDHSVNLLATYDLEDNLTGIVFNAPMTAQETGGLFAISADVWCEARQELRQRFGEKLYIFPQVSAAGELTPRVLYDTATHERMLQLKGRTSRQELAHRIANSVEEILPYLPQAIDRQPVLTHLVNTVDLPVNALTEADVEEAEREIAKYRETYDAEIQRLEADPAAKNEKRWYQLATTAYRRMNWHKSVIARYERQKTHPAFPAEVHTIHLGDIVFATNPFEYYLDFGVQIKLRSPAVQTFIVELACGGGTYVPSLRSTEGGGYGSVPGSYHIGPEGGQVLADETVGLIRSLWEK